MLRSLFIMCGWAALCGCGPLQSTAFLVDAETMLEAARASDAERLAPYEWTKANLYFLKAKEEVGYSDYEQGVDFAKKAVDLATQAKESAQKTAKKEAPPPEPRP
jgi:hypothetical protein